MTLLEAGVPYLGACESLGTHKPIIDIYNSIRPLPRGYRMNYSDAWCMAFVSVCAKLAGQPDRFPYECSCHKAVMKLQDEGLWMEDDAYIPETNDLIFYHWGTCTGDCQETPNHVGIVASVRDGMIRVLEGNYSDRVQWREINIDNKNIRGFGITSELWGMMSNDITAVAHQVINGKWGNNPERSQLLEAAGYDPFCVQVTVNYILNSEVQEDADDLYAVAVEVLQGKWGNGNERKKALIAAGYDYEAVREIVNNYFKKGESL